ncbi:MAG: helix-turn-helix domain-containing protein [Patescibacteria group bacterium]
MTQAQALDIMKTGANIFLTGEPGSGKTHIINQYVSYLRSCGIDPAITASTGIAATHIGGMTIHSWSGIGIRDELSRHEADKIASDKRIAKRINAADVLIIDEISMLPPKTLDMVEAICRRVKKNPNPFGGLQVILVGDFFQLPPIIRSRSDNSQTSYLDELSERFAYGSTAWKAADLKVCYLSEQYRQDDQDYLELLSAIRSNSFGASHLAYLQQRKVDYKESPGDLPKLFSHNIDVDRVNNEMLAKLPGEYQSYTMMSYGSRHLIEIMQRGCLSPEILELKVGASVMFTKNNPKGSFVNGTLGTVDGFDPASGYPIIATHSGRRLIVEPAEWALEDNGTTVATITQIPLRLAWAITVHKSQGMSLDGAVMDLSSVFEFGQGYVALSRVRRLSGLHLLGWNKRAFEVHPDIVTKDNDFKLASENDCSAYGNMSSKDLKNVHNDFINLCGGSPGIMEEKDVPDFYPIKKIKVKIDTHEATLALWREGKGLAEIAEARQLKENTILSHLEKLSAKGKIKAEDFLKLIPAKLAQALPQIHQIFEKLETDKLALVFEHFGGKYGYDDLRLARLVMKK